MIFFFIALVLIIGNIAINMPPPSEMFYEDPPPIFGILVYVFAFALMMLCLLFAVDEIVSLV